ncbi:MAG: methyltransferase type 11 [Ramlibacter sp.]|nr:methyltransferase type 11 [Ramlibacter sp.]
MQTIGALQRYIKDNGGIVAATRKVARLSWMLLRTVGVSALTAEIRNTLRIRRVQVALLRRKKMLASLARKKEVTILATPHTMYVAYMLSYGLSQAGFRVSIVTSPPAVGYGEDIHIVICPQMFAKLPVHMVAFQMEQSISPRWFTKSYLKLLRDSLAVLDYSRTNIEFLTQQGIPYGNIFYVPIMPIPGYLNFLSSRGLSFDRDGEKAYDVLFYGDVNNQRRQMMLGELSKRFDVKIVGNLFGAKLYEYMLRARVVVNIHYYENALLETTRICECLSLGIPIVSESSLDRADYPDLELLVRFVEVGDAAAMIEAVENILGAGDAPPTAQVRTSPPGDVEAADPSFHLNRFLLAHGLTDLDVLFEHPALPPRFATGRICLSLPETGARRASFLSRGLAGYEVFDGLRNAQSWIGCGLSYKYLLKRAKNVGLRQVLICEDDVVIDRESDAALSVVESYLASLNGGWDVFVGLIAHLHTDAKVSHVEEFGGMTFVHLDKMTSMVLNIYHHSIFDLLIAWDESNEDPKTNTIDRYLEGIENLRVITALPFIAGHSEEDASTLWGFGNKQYAGLISGSQALLEQKVGAFLKSRH